MTIKQYACIQCGVPYEAYTPDDHFTYAMRKQCTVCNALKLGQYVEQNYECDNCNTKNTLFWHVKQEHSEEQKIKAKRQREIDFWNSLGRKKDSIL